MRLDKLRSFRKFLQFGILLVVLLLHDGSDLIPLFPFLETQLVLFFQLHQVSVGVIILLLVLLVVCRLILDILVVGLHIRLVLIESLLVLLLEEVIFLLLVDDQNTLFFFRLTILALCAIKLVGESSVLFLQLLHSALVLLKNVLLISLALLLDLIEVSILLSLLGPPLLQENISLSNSALFRFIAFFNVLVELVPS